MANTLLGHLALNPSVAASPENVGSESLAYILRESPPARRGLASLLATAGIAIPIDLDYRTQSAGVEGERPDVVGFDDDREPLIIEAKFGAGLTANQPISYLKRLPPDRSGVVLFVVPTARIVPLWNELMLICSKDPELSLGERDRRPINGPIAREISHLHHLAIVSWRQVIGAIKMPVEEAGEAAIAGDLDQLSGLCDRMDSVPVYLPISEGELTSTAYRRVLDFDRMIVDITGRLSGDWTSHGLMLTHGLGFYGRYLLVHGIQVYLSCDVAKWTTLHPTPLWLTVFGPAPTYRPNALVDKALASLKTSIPRRLFTAVDEAPGKGMATIPLFVSPGSERDAVMAQVVDQLEEVASLLESVGGSGESRQQPAPPVPSEDEAASSMDR